jgi:hypothetical protein
MWANDTIGNRITAFFFAPVDRIRMDAFRISLAISLLLYMFERWRYAKEWLTPAGFHISAENLPFHPSYAPPVPQSALPFLGIAMFGSLMMLALGWRIRLMAVISLVSLLYVTFADQLSAFTLNKLSIFSLAVLASAPTTSPQAVWPVRILQMTIVIQYFAAGWGKAVMGDWLVDPYSLYSQIVGIYRTDFAAWLLTHFPKEIWIFFQYSTLAFELLAPLIFAVRRLRPIALLWGLSFHLVIALCMSQFIYFSLVMVSFYVLFLNEATLRRVLWFLPEP